MDIALDTIEVWQIDGEFELRDFLRGITPLLSVGDVVLFGSYEPTEELRRGLEDLGATSHRHLEGYFMCFDVNRAEHPNGCAFRYVIQNSGFERLLQLDDKILTQKDIPSFYDHVIAFRPGIPQLPLISFHDAASGGSLYLSGHYSESDAQTLAVRLSGRATRIPNPVLAIETNANEAVQ